MTDLKAKTSGLLFHKMFVNDKGQMKGEKTQTYRIKAETSFETLRNAVNSGGLIPCKTNYSNESIFGWLFVFLLEKVAFISIEAEDMMYEGFATTPTLTEFEQDWFKGMSEDQKRSSNFMWPGKNGQLRPSVLCKLKFFFIANHAALPKELKHLTELWKGGSPSTCVSCNLVCSTGRGTVVCSNIACGRAVHAHAQCSTEAGTCCLCAKLSQVLEALSKPDAVGTAASDVRGSGDDHQLVGEAASVMMCFGYSW